MGVKLSLSCALIVRSAQANRPATSAAKTIERRMFKMGTTPFKTGKLLMLNPMMQVAASLLQL
jgi:hypothetical protein